MFSKKGFALLFNVFQYFLGFSIKSGFFWIGINVGTKFENSFNICFLQNILFAAYEVVSNYEAFISNKKANKSNPILVTTILIAMVIISLTLLLTDLFINCFFKIKRNVQKPKIQNTIKFKTLTGVRVFLMFEGTSPYP